MAEPPSKFFVKRTARSKPRASSAFSGDDEASPDALRPHLRKRAAVSTSATLKAGFGELVDVTSPVRRADELILGRDTLATLLGVANEFRRGDEIRRHGLSVRSKLLFCGPPGCGKSLCAEVVAAELQMPLVTARLDAIIASHLGETATNLRKLFDAARTRSAVLFLDEFDALARARDDENEHSEIRRVVNSLLMMIDRFDGRGLLIAATNLEKTVDRAIWRRFDEVVVFDKPNLAQIQKMLALKTRNFETDFDVSRYADQFIGMSFAQIERTCTSAIRSAILMHKKTVSSRVFERAVAHEKKRAEIERSILA